MKLSHACLLSLIPYLPSAAPADDRQGVQASIKPNIVFILADDMSFDSVSSNNPKIGNMKTPHIDKLIFKA